MPAQNLTVRQMDIRTGQLPGNAYDLVTCRAMLHQISEYAPAVLEQMAAAVKPGGWLYVESGLALGPPAGFEAHRHLKAGAVHAHLWRRADNPTS